MVQNYKNKNWLQFLFIVKAAVLKQQISKFYPQIQCNAMQCNAMTIMGTGASLYAYILLTIIMCTKTFQFML